MSEDFLFSKSNYLHPRHSGQHHSVFTDYRDQNLSTTTEYVPTLKQTGYIVGDPVTYTNNQNSIPRNIQTHTHKNPPNVKFDFQSPVNQRTRSLSRVFNPIESQKNSRVHVINPPIPIQKVHHQSQQQMISKKQYEKCVSECKIWQSKFNELYNTYINKPSQSSSNQQIMLVRNQNVQLRARINQLQFRQRKVYQNLQNNFIRLVNKYKQTTLKQCILLVDRYRLQKKHQQKY